MTTGAGTTNIAYDWESRTTSLTGPGVNSTFAYNGLDTRVSKNAQSFLRDGAYVTDPVLRDGQATFTPGISERRGSTTTFHHSGLKSADAQSSIAQTLTATKQFDAFGNLASSTGTWQGPFGYAGGFGYQTESESGLMLLGHRYMDPSTGRFLTRDPVKDGRNWYGYVGNNPVALADPTGLFAWVPIILGIILIIDIIDTANDVGEIINDPTDPGNYIWPIIGAIDISPGNIIKKIAKRCFVAGTKIVLADGSTKAIEDVRPGDSVLSRPEDGDEGEKPTSGKVARTFKHEAEGTLLLRLEDGQTVETTDEHPFFVKGKGFVEAGRLTVDDRIAEDKAQTTRILAIVRLKEAKTVYNFEVEGTHTYFVRAGDDNLWVHNKRIKFVPDPDAVGDHVTFRTDPSGQRVSHYQEWIVNAESPSGFGRGKRFDGVGRDHGGIPTPHVHPPKGNARVPQEWEIPKFYE